MGKMKEKHIELQQQMYENAKANRHDLGEAHWLAVAEMVQELIESEERVSHDS